MATTLSDAKAVCRRSVEIMADGSIEDFDGTFCEYGADGRISTAFPPTGRRFTITQTYWFRMADGKIIEHWANRDDLGMSMQLGWLSSPLYLLRAALATRRARRAATR